MPDRGEVIHHAIKVDEFNGRLTIVVPWRLSAASLFTWTLLAVLACLCFGGMAAGLIIDNGDDAPIGGLIFCAFVIGLAGYFLSAYWLNRTTIEVTRASITGEHGPIPFPRSRSFAIERDEIDQVYVQLLKEVIGAHVRVSCQVCAVLTSGDRFELFNCGYPSGRTLDETKALAERLERQIETFLGIEDRPVDGTEVTVVVPLPARVSPGP